MQAWCTWATSARRPATRLSECRGSAPAAGRERTAATFRSSVRRGGFKLFRICRVQHARAAAVIRVLASDHVCVMGSVVCSPPAGASPAAGAPRGPPPPGGTKPPPSQKPAKKEEEEEEDEDDEEEGSEEEGTFVALRTVFDNQCNPRIIHVAETEEDDEDEEGTSRLCRPDTCCPASFAFLRRR